MHKNTTPIINVLQYSEPKSRQMSKEYSEFCQEYFDAELKPKSACVEMFGPKHGEIRPGRIHWYWKFPVPVGGGAFIEATVYAHTEAGVVVEVPENASVGNAWIVWKWFMKMVKETFQQPKVEAKWIPETS